MAQFYSIASVKHIEDASIIAEIQCFLKGEFRIPELPFDRENLSASFIEHVRENGSEWDSPDYYIAEPEACYQEGRALVEREVALELEEFASILNDHYPFTVSGRNSQVITLKDDVSPVGIAYIWLRLYMLSVSVNNYLQFDDSAVAEVEKESKVFHSLFTKVFEYLSAFAVSGRYKGKTWMTSKSRSAQDYLEILGDVCDSIGHGRPKAHDNLRRNQRVTNDGRTDMVTITMPDGDFQADSELYLTQATIQKKDLKSKVVRRDDIDFFNDFFLEQIEYAKSGILIVPHVNNPLHQSECGSANCVYMHLGRIFEYLGLVEANDNFEIIGQEFIASYRHLEQGINIQRFS